jgi:hypothetical protein
MNGSKFVWKFGAPTLPKFADRSSSSPAETTKTEGENLKLQNWGKGWNHSGLVDPISEDGDRGKKRRELWWKSGSFSRCGNSISPAPAAATDVGRRPIAEVAKLGETKFPTFPAHVPKRPHCSAELSPESMIQENRELVTNEPAEFEK